MSHAKNYKNLPVFHGAIQKNKMGCFCGPHCRG